MRKINKLKRDARDSAEWRGHYALGNFKAHPYWGERIQIATCKRCGMQVVVNSRPAPNEVNIGGEAVALNCKALHTKQGYLNGDFVIVEVWSDRSVHLYESKFVVDSDGKIVNKEVLKPNQTNAQKAFCKNALREANDAGLFERSRLGL